jgi:peptide/nickel transport system permease protein
VRRAATGGLAGVSRFVLRKVGHVAIVLLLVTLGTSMLLQLTPGDPAQALLGENASPEAMAQVREQLHLNDSIPSQYWRWLSGALHGDLGTSFKTGASVTELIMTALPVTAELVVLTLLLALVISVPLGLWCGAHEGGRVDRATSTLSSVAVAVPPFVSVPILVYLLVLRAGLLPATGWVDLGQAPLENLRHVILPVLALVLVEVPVFVAALRSDVSDTMRQDFILNARAKGVPPRRVLFRHALRPSSFSLLTLAGVSLGRLIGGAIVVEVLFSLPGIGTLTVNAINGKDVPVVQGVVLFVAALYVVVNVLVDIAYGLIDPRVRTVAAAQ